MNMSDKKPYDPKPLFNEKGKKSEYRYKNKKQTLQRWPSVDRADMNDQAKVILKLLRAFSQSYFNMSNDLYFQWYDKNALSWAHNRNLDQVAEHELTTPDMVQDFIKEFIENGWVTVEHKKYTKEHHFNFWSKKPNQKKYGDTGVALYFNQDKVDKDLYDAGLPTQLF